MKALELYSGIGGFHIAIKGLENKIEVCCAIDINTNANETYVHNFPETRVWNRNIESLTSRELDKLDLDIIWMSPPCQPFTRIGKKLDCNDKRTCSFLHLLDILASMQKKPTYIMLENVKGFENSDARNAIFNTLKPCGYSMKEYLLTPIQFGIPNSRLRYYLVAKLMMNADQVQDCEEEIFYKTGLEVEEQNNLELYLERGHPSEYFERFLVPNNILLKYKNLFDIVDEKSQQSCCFTKAYGHYIEGTGSVLHTNLNFTVKDIYDKINISENEQNCLDLLKSLHLRYFTPREIANLMGFPKEFNFPSNFSLKQQYKLLGNSLNVAVVYALLKISLDPS